MAAGAGRVRRAGTRGAARRLVGLVRLRGVGRQLAADPEVTAVLCGNDTMALGVMRALAEHGLRVPHDVSIVGFNDVPEAGLQPAADHGAPGLRRGGTAGAQYAHRPDVGRDVEAGLRVRIAPELSHQDQCRAAGPLTRRAACGAARPPGQLVAAAPSWPPTAG